MINYNQNGTTITYYDIAKYLSVSTNNKSLFEDLKRIFEICYPNPLFLIFNKQFKNNDEALDFFCGTKWPIIFNNFVEEVVTKLTEGKLC